MATSERVQQILSEVRALSDDEKTQLEAELLADDGSVGRAWGDEIDRRATRVLTTNARGLDRDEMRSLFGMDPAGARARLAELLAARK
jgi:hypothetical protein